MAVTKRQPLLKYVGFGVLLGLIIGAIDVSASVLWLWKMGRPDFLIRPGAEAFHAVIVIVLGLILGFIMGLVISLYAWLRNRQLRRDAAIFVTLISASVVYGAGYPMLIHYRQLLPWLLVMHAVVVVSSLACVMASAQPHEV
jgi:hypothetical protein